MSVTSIEWADRVWNPVTGCTKVSQGCKHCYAEVIAERFFAQLYRPVLNDGSGRTIDTITTSAHDDYMANGLARPRRFTDVQCHPDRLDAPLRWRKPSRIFVNSMSDLFHEDVPDAFIDQVFAVMAEAERHTFLVLTKRPERMRVFLDGPGSREAPLPNVWLGVSIEDQATADQRIPLLLQTPAAVRWVSAEPLLGPITILREWRGLGHRHRGQADDDYVCCCGKAKAYHVGLDWVVVGGESGQKARPCNVAWISSVVEQCQSAAVPVFVKQLGADPRWQDVAFSPIAHARGKNNDPDEWPHDIRVRQFPAVQCHRLREAGRA